MSTDVIAICNALVDVMIPATDADLTALNLEKGIMHLVEADRQQEILDYFHDRDIKVELGGSSLNALRSLAKMEIKTGFVGMIGKDEYGKKISSRMSELQITAHLRETDTATGSCIVLISPDGERTMNTCLGASRLYDQDAVPHDAIKQASILHFCGYQWDTEGQKKAIHHAMDTARAAGTKVSFDLADPFVVGRNREAFQETATKHADIVFANEEEARLLFETDPREAARLISANGATAVVKLGAKGAIIQRGNDIVEIEAVKTSVVDTTAAGDTFAAGFLYGVLKNKDLAASGKTAATMAADVISRVGTTVNPEVLAIAVRL